MEWRYCDSSAYIIYMEKSRLLIDSADFLLNKHREKGTLASGIACIHAAHFIINAICANRLGQIPITSTPHREMPSALLRINEFESKDKKIREKLKGLFELKNKWEYLRAIPSAHDIEKWLKVVNRFYEKVTSLL